MFSDITTIRVTYWVIQKWLEELSTTDAILQPGPTTRVLFYVYVVGEETTCLPG